MLYELKYKVGIVFEEHADLQYTHNNITYG